MCKVYNTVGSFTVILSHLHQHNIYDFHSLNEIITFQKNYSDYRQQTILDHEHLIEQEKKHLVIEITLLDSTIQAKKTDTEHQLRKEIDTLEQKRSELAAVSPAGFISTWINEWNKWFLKQNIRYRERTIVTKINNSVRQLVKIWIKKNDRYRYITTHFETAVQESCEVPIKALERKKRIIDEVNTFIYGALGEQKVVRTLEHLPDDCYLINDFSIAFSQPIYNRQENTYIKSVQIDHLLITPAGIFLIETKNWSEESLNNLNLRSPVEQIRRANFALYKVLMDTIGRSNTFYHHWGRRKIPIKNLLVFTNLKPIEAFEYVRILTINELTGYIRYFKPIFSPLETQKITDYLLSLTYRR